MVNPISVAIPKPFHSYLRESGGENERNMTRSTDDLPGLITGLEHGETLPAHWYTDPAVTEREINQIFRRSWNYVGH